MSIDRMRFEADRLINMVKAFGWEMTSQQIVGDKIAVMIEKVVREGVPETKAETEGA
jgi:hypothetical protein